jgi:hypothetical protein
VDVEQDVDVNATPPPPPPPLQDPLLREVAVQSSVSSVDDDKIEVIIALGNSSVDTLFTMYYVCMIGRRRGRFAKISLLSDKKGLPLLPPAVCCLFPP